ncbi:hypothetical protein [Maribacter sp. Hel_I_7]|uniref:hypothetical protein n=1 Tax=Maribacter sp. Hel_I_7 TaxID=1249997 RepID=UPI00047D00E0|nr:hypothetical protein [Maribacter sp. Hel_I_7]
MKTTLKIFLIATIFAGTTANAQVNTIDSVATSKVQHFNFDEMESETIGEGIQNTYDALNIEGLLKKL